jgi:type VI secretion system secreted protein Hcp
VAIADMFLKMSGVTGESKDQDFAGAIDVVSWSWGLHAPTALGGAPTGRASMTELTIVKHADTATTTLLQFAKNHKNVGSACLSVRKAGATPLTYLKIEMTDVRVTDVHIDTVGTNVVERVQLGFAKLRVTYTPQGSSGAKGGGDSMFEDDANAGI